MFKVGVNSDYWYDESRQEESLRYISECGIEAIDYDACGHFDRTFDKENLTSFYDKSMEELYAHYDVMNKALKDHNVVISQWHGLYPIYFHGEDARNDYIIEVANKMIALCAYTNCNAIVMHPWTGLDMTKKEEREINLSVYRRMMPAAKKYGVKICLENLFRHIGGDCVEGSCADAEEAVWYVDTLNAEAGEEVFGFCLDIGHANLMGKNLYQYITILGSRLTLLHINDNNGTDDYHMIPYSQLRRSGKQTSIDWDNFIRGLKEIGYQGDLSFETHRGIDILPEEIRTDGLKFVSAIGRYFKKRLTE